MKCNNNEQRNIDGIPTMSKYEQLPKGVIFDMDGVLVDSEPLINKSSSMMFGELGLEVNPDDFDKFVGTGEDQFIKGVAEKYGYQIDVKTAKERTYDIYLENIKGELNSFPGVFEFIAECKKRQKKIALATSADYRKLEGNLKEIDLPLDTFDTIVTGQDVENKKPAPDIFLLAAGRLQLKPEHCLVIEDSVVGVEAAKAAGARCLALTTSFTWDLLKKADYIASDLSNVPKEALLW